MAVKPSPDRSDLESKTREDLQTIAKVKGVDISARASKASLIEAIIRDVIKVVTSKPNVKHNLAQNFPASFFLEMVGFTTPITGKPVCWDFHGHSRGRLVRGW